MEVELQLFSPRWGHDDTYHVEFQRDFLEIRMQPRVARAEYRPNLDPLWSGEALASIMKNDSIWPPADVSRFFEKVWLAWRNGEIDDAAAAAELDALADWLNAITRAKPRTQFWRGYF